MTGLSLKPMVDTAMIDVIGPDDTLVTVSYVNGVKVVRRLPVSTFLSSMKFENPAAAPTGAGIPYTIGGLAAGTVIENMSLGTIIQKLLFPIPVPDITAFTTTLAQTYMCGEYTPNSGGFSWNITHPTYLTNAVGAIVDVTTGTQLATYDATTVSAANVSFGGIGYVRNTPGTYSIENRITVENVVKSKSITFTWKWATIYGTDAVSDSLVTSAQIVSMPRSFTTGTLSLTIPAGARRVIVAVPQGGTAPKRVTDLSLGVDILGSFTAQNITLTRNSASTTYTVYSYLSSVPLAATTMTISFL